MPGFSCSAVLIVRDEEAVLDACLRSVRPLVDEILVLDTGSRDRSPDIARRSGARVIEAGWPDDFAAARNEALARAQGTWILSIDADERVERGDGPGLRARLAATSAAACRVWLRPAALFTPYRHCRLFRNDPRIRFEGRICESLLPSIRRLGAAYGDAPVDDCDIAITHRDNPVVRRRKHARDLPLLQEAVREDSGNVEYWTGLGRARAALGNIGGASNAWRRAIDQVRRQTRVKPADSLPYSDLLEATRGTDFGRRRLLDEASERFPDNWLLVWLRADALVAERRFAQAERLLRRLAAIDGMTYASPALAYDRRIFDEFAYAALGNCCFALGRHDEAAAWYGRAEIVQPASLEYHAKRVLARRRAAGSPPLAARDWPMSGAR